MDLLAIWFPFDSLFLYFSSLLLLFFFLFLLLLLALIFGAFVQFAGENIEHIIIDTYMYGPIHWNERRTLHIYANNNERNILLFLSPSLSLSLSIFVNTLIEQRFHASPAHFFSFSMWKNVVEWEFKNEATSRALFLLHHHQIYQKLFFSSSFIVYIGIDMCFKKGEQRMNRKKIAEKNRKSNSRLCVSYFQLFQSKNVDASNELAEKERWKGKKTPADLCVLGNADRKVFFSSSSFFYEMKNWIFIIFFVWTHHPTIHYELLLMHRQNNIH